MPDAGLKGVSADQDRRYKDKDAEWVCYYQL